MWIVLSQGLKDFFLFVTFLKQLLQTVQGFNIGINPIKTFNDDAVNDFCSLFTCCSVQPAYFKKLLSIRSKWGLKPCYPMEQEWKMIMRRQWQEYQLADCRFKLLARLLGRENKLVQLFYWELSQVFGGVSHQLLNFIIRLFDFQELLKELIILRWFSDFFSCHIFYIIYFVIAGQSFSQSQTILIVLEVLIGFSIFWKGLKLKIHY